MASRQRRSAKSTAFWPARRKGAHHADQGRAYKVWSMLASASGQRRRAASVGGGQDVPQLLIDVIAIETDFDELMRELHQ